MKPCQKIQKQNGNRLWISSRLCFLGSLPCCKYFFNGCLWSINTYLFLRKVLHYYLKKKKTNYKIGYKNLKKSQGKIPPSSCSHSLQLLCSLNAKLQYSKHWINGQHENGYLAGLAPQNSWQNDKKGWLCVSLQHIYFWKNVSCPSYSPTKRRLGLSLNS